MVVEKRADVRVDVCVCVMAWPLTSKEYTVSMEVEASYRNNVSNTSCQKPTYGPYHINGRQTSLASVS